MTSSHPLPLGEGWREGLERAPNPFLFSPNRAPTKTLSRRLPVRRTKALARAQRLKPTDAESLLWQLLRRRQLLGFKFRRQSQFGDYISDFYCSEASLVIECDGAIHQEDERWHHDRIRDAYMISQGVRVLRFTNEQILGNPSAVLDEIAKHLPEKRED